MEIGQKSFCATVQVKQIQLFLSHPRPKMNRSPMTQVVINIKYYQTSHTFFKQFSIFLGANNTKASAILKQDGRCYCMVEEESANGVYP